MARSRNGKRRPLHAPAGPLPTPHERFQGDSNGFRSPSADIAGPGSHSNGLRSSADATGPVIGRQGDSHLYKADANGTGGGRQADGHLYKADANGAGAGGGRQADGHPYNGNGIRLGEDGNYGNGFRSVKEEGSFLRVREDRISSLRSEEAASNVQRSNGPRSREDTASNVQQRSNGSRLREESNGHRLKEDSIHGLLPNGPRLREESNGHRLKEGSIHGLPPKEHLSHGLRSKESGNGLRSKDEGIGRRTIEDNSGLARIRDEGKERRLSKEDGNGVRMKEEGSDRLFRLKDGTKVWPLNEEMRNLQLNEESRQPPEGRGGLRSEGSRDRRFNRQDVHNRPLKDATVQCDWRSETKDSHSRRIIVDENGGSGVNRVNLSASMANSKEEVNPQVQRKDQPGALEKHAEQDLNMVKAKELKEEGNRQFQRKDYAAAMELYKQALNLTPHDHPDRAVYHSNRAACLMQMQPVQYEAAIYECSLALEVYPGFSRALLRRARAFEALGKLELALEDVEMLLQVDGTHPDALDLFKRLRFSLGILEEAQQEIQGRTAAGTGASYYARSYSMGPSVVSTPLHHLGRSHSSIQASDAMQSFSKHAMPDDRLNGDNAIVSDAPPPPCPVYGSPAQMSKSSSLQVPESPIIEEGEEQEAAPPVEELNPASVEPTKEQQNAKTLKEETSNAALQMRQVKLIYHDDIRLAEMPVNSKFPELRKLVRQKFPSSKAVLIKYRDMEGDLVTITSTSELRLAEVAAGLGAAKKTSELTEGLESVLSITEQCKAAIGLSVSPVLHPLRLHVVEVPPEQEPVPKGEDALTDVNADEVNLSSQDSSGSNDEGGGKAGEAQRDMDKWLVDFAQLVHTHLGIDPSAAASLHDLGMELCSEALEEAVSCEEAEPLFAQAASKFQEMAARAFFNWGNIYMCAARKQTPHDEADAELEFWYRLQAAFDWAQSQFALAEEMFDKALQVKPDFYEGILALGQKDFENAKLHWSLAVARQVDLTTWDLCKTMDLFRSAEEKVEKAVAILEKVQQSGISKSSFVSEKNGKKDSSSGSEGGSTDADIRKQVEVTRSQMYLFWGNILYEHSQVEFRLGLLSWNQLLDAAVQKFEVAGVSPSEIMTALEKHLSSSSTFLDVRAAIGQQELNTGSGLAVECQENAVIPDGISTVSNVNEVNVDTTS